MKKESDASPEMVERVAVRLFWKAEHLDPTADGNCPEAEWFGDTFPSALSERRRSFWRYLAVAAIQTQREPTEAMLNATTPIAGENPSACEIWYDMIDAALK
jgi:hypothetical protein